MGAVRCRQRAGVDGLRHPITSAGSCSLAPLHWQALPAGEIGAVGEEGEDLARGPAPGRRPRHRPRRRPDVCCRRAHSEQDVEVLSFVGQHIASALTRARAIEETRERNAELSVINEIGEALARQLDFGAITELVGERVRTIFEASSMFIAFYDPATDPAVVPLHIDEGQRFDRPDDPDGAGPDLAGHHDGPPSASALTPRRSGWVPSRWAGRRPNSFLGVPIVAGDRVIGVIAIERLELDASPRPMSGSCPRSRRAWAWPSRTPDCSGRPSACLPNPTNGRRSWPSSTRSATALAKQLDFEAIMRAVGERDQLDLSGHDRSRILLYDQSRRRSSFRRIRDR